MAEAKKTNYGNESISSLKGADRVRKRPGVIFGSDGLDGCEHAVFEILSNSIDEAREGHGKLITVTRYLDHSIEVEDMGRGCPVDYNPKEKRFNWELVYCELYLKRQVQQLGRRQLRILPRPQRPRRVRDAVFLALYGRDRLARREQILPAL